MAGLMRCGGPLVLDGCETPESYFRIRRGGRREQAAVAAVQVFVEEGRRIGEDDLVRAARIKLAILLVLGVRRSSQENTLKLRIHDNSIRLRLNRQEVAQFQETGVVQAAVQFGSGAALAFSLESSAGAVALQALFGDGNLRVIVPESQGRHWASSDEVGMEAQDAQPAILIEKDFQCMHQEHKDPEAYPNPLLN